MTDKIQELTEKIYTEGVLKAKAEADRIISEATEKAKNILSEAERQKLEILSQAQKEIQELKDKTNSEIDLAAKRVIGNLMQYVSEKLLALQIDPSVEKAFRDERFIQDMILLMIQNWTKLGEKEPEINLLVPPGEENKIRKFFEAELKKGLSLGIQLNIDENLKNGFRIEPRNGRYYISFTSEDFKSYFKSQLKEKTRELIFGPEKDT